VVNIPLFAWVALPFIPVREGKRNMAHSPGTGASLADVARLAKVSTQTASRVANGSDAVRPDTRERVLAAMAELGYTLYGRGANGIRGQYLYRMHGDTVVHVSCSDQGIIAMEVGRAAAGQRQLDAAEVAEQVQDMETFCGDYAALQQSLARKGVRCKSNIVMSPPHPMYAHVLDTSEYELKKAVDTGAAQTVHRYIDGEG